MHRTLLLARTLFGRFFESDLMPPGLPQVQLVVWMLALLAAPSFLLPVVFAMRYGEAVTMHKPLAHAFLIHRLLFVTLTMTAIGMVGLVVWDGMFPDRRDARILGALPVPGRVLIAARLLALSALCALFVAGIVAIPTVIYGATLGSFGGASSILHGMVAHLVSTAMSGVFVFTSLVFLQGIVLNVGGRRAADRLSLILQVVFVTLLLQMIFFLGRVSGVLTTDLDVGWLAVLPSLWFLGLYDIVGGIPAPGASRLAVAAVVATGVTSIGSVLIFVATHPRLTKRALEGVQAGRKRSIIGGLFQRIAYTIARVPASRAVLEFTVRTLARTRSHRLLMAMYFGVALAFIASAIGPLAFSSGLAGFAEPSIEMLSAPFFLSFFTLVGMRVAFAIPVEPKANWILRLIEPAAPTARVAAMEGARTAMMLIGVAPSVVLAVVTAAALWGVREALVHGIVAAMMGWVLTELLLIRYAKLPFTCIYFPGNGKVGTLWPLYLTGFVNYTLTTAAFEVTVMKHRSMRAVVIFTLVTASIASLTMLRRRQVAAALPGLRFDEEDPEKPFSGFNLSEGFAAATPESRQLR